MDGFLIFPIGFEKLPQESMVFLEVEKWMGKTGVIFAWEATVLQRCLRKISLKLGCQSPSSSQRFMKKRKQQQKKMAWKTSKFHNATTGHSKGTPS